MLDFTILVLPGAYAASVAATQDMLHAASVLAPRMGDRKPAWKVVSPDGGSTALSGGLCIETRRAPLRAGRDTSIWVVPGLGLDSIEAVVPRLAQADAQRAASLLRQHSAAGGIVAASCSAAFLLEHAGLLQGRRATTSWWLATELQRMAPKCSVNADRMIVSDGQVITAGAAFGHSDLILHLLGLRFGSSLAQAVGKLLLIEGRQAQAPFVVPSMLANGHELIGRLMRRIESSLPQPPKISELAGEFAMSERTLARRVRAYTGHGPLALVQNARLQQARLLIESSRMTMDQIAASVGYEDATALRRMVRKVTGANPSQFRGASKTITD
ncbi:GlxA family transcriptional regulator [Acidovorax sp. ACV01]|uniref:GlxA family transcriptional regulator n=1 Tax=Acidovorax sp. ACV01 TaxID=2769311 RepID=UPI001784476E|nr:helix-turn-helix domain-containing protein [Acidovorax sp. ACV01]MBD9395833.1 helix-turn-helix domain-containing protein [Acidovorax sp. ACV01]